MPAKSRSIHPSSIVWETVGKQLGVRDRAPLVELCGLRGGADMRVFLYALPIRGNRHLSLVGGAVLV